MNLLVRNMYRSVDPKKLLGPISAIIVSAMLAACSTSTSSVDGLDDNTTATQQAAAGETEAQENPVAESAEGQAKEREEKLQETAKVIRRKGSTSKKGTHIRVLVNNVPITNYDVKRRAAFLGLRRVPGNRTKKAEEELIEQAIKMAEARRTGNVATSTQVNEAFANFAKSNRISSSRMATELGRMGIGADHFKGFIRSQISWNRTVGRRFSTQARQKTQQEAIFELKKAGSDKPETTEYAIKQIVFVVPENKRKAIISARRKEANNFRQRFNSCDQAITMAKELRDVAVIDRGRVMEPELPPNWRESILGTEVNKTTRPQDTKRGVELMAVCNKRTVSDDRAAQIVSQAKEFEDFNKKGEAASKEYLGDLRKKAIIIYR